MSAPRRWTYATRLNSFRAAGKDILAAIDMAAAVPGLTAVELNYPQHLGAGDGRDLVAAIADRGLRLTALNMRYDGPRFAMGALSHPDAATRAEAVALTIAAVDFAAAHGANHVIIWPGTDGFDVPWQADYARHWDWLVEGLRAVASHNPAIRVSVEYKPNDPRRIAFVRTASDALLLARESGCANAGVTVDYCHALMAGESPSMAASLALRDGRLFGLHLNDGYGDGDDGLPVGSVNSWRTVELLYTLRKHQYDGLIYFDTFPDRVDPARELAANIHSVERYTAAVERLDLVALEQAQATQDSLTAQRILLDALIGVCP